MANVGNLDAKLEVTLRIIYNRRGAFFHKLESITWLLLVMMIKVLNITN